jgi:hypothetical protein
MHDRISYTVPAGHRQRLVQFFAEAGLDAENVGFFLLHPGNIGEWLQRAALTQRNVARGVLGAYTSAIEQYDDMLPPLAETGRGCMLCARAIDQARLIVVAVSEASSGTASVAAPLCWGCYDTYGGTEKRVLRAIRQRYREQGLPDLRRRAAEGAP